MNTPITANQVRALVVAARRIYDQLVANGATDESFDEWRSDICLTATGQTSFRSIPKGMYPKMAGILGASVASSKKPYRGRMDKGKYYLKAVIKETGYSDMAVATICRRLFGHGDFKILTGADAKRLGHILQDRARRRDRNQN